MVPAGNKAKRLSSVNHTTKTIHHQFIINEIELLSTFPKMMMSVIVVIKFNKYAGICK